MSETGASAGGGKGTPDPLLMTPGPTRIPERVLRAGLRVIHHRTPDFSAALAELLERARPLFGTQSADVLPVHGTGRAAMEGAIANFFSAGDVLVACCNGKFGEMWARIAEVYGVRVVRVCTDWARSVDPDEVSAALDAHPGARAVTVVHSDSSTGALNPVADVARVAREHGALSLVDGISSIGGAALGFDDAGLDFAVVASQKCLMSSPGLALVAVGARAREAERDAKLPRSYLSFSAIRETLTGERPETPGTTPVGLVLQVLEALRAIDEEGRDGVFARHAAMAAAVRERSAALGFGLFGGDGIEARTPTLTALTVPHGTDPAAVRAAMRARGILTAAGLGEHRATCLRIGHLGDIRMADVERTMDALAEVTVAAAPAR